MAAKDPKQTYMIRQKIARLDEKIQHLEEAKYAVHIVKSSCSGKVDGWQANRGKLSGVTPVKKADLFEGEVAGKLGTYVQDILNQISQGIQTASQLNSALEQQISSIERRIGELSAQRQNLYWQL